MIRYPEEIIRAINHMDHDDFLKLLKNNYNIGFLLYYCKWLIPEYQKIIIDVITKCFSKYN